MAKNDDSPIPLINARRLDGRTDLLLIDQAIKGLDDIAAGLVNDARSALMAIKKDRAVKSPKPG